MQQNHKIPDITTERARRRGAARHPADIAYDGMRVEWADRGVRTPRVSFGRVRYLPEGYCGPRIQRDYELVLLISGRCDVRVDRVPLALAPDELHLFKPGRREVFRFDADRPTHHVWCSAAARALPPALRRELNRTRRGGVVPSQLFRGVLAMAFSLREIRSADDARVADALAAALFAEFARIAKRARAAVAEDPFVTRALRTMEDGLADPGCLAAAHRAAGCSRNALIYKFARVVGATPARHLWQLRAEKGLAMLRETGLSVSEIADRCGFKNPFHFSRRIRALQGESPRAVRRRAWA